MNTKHIKVDIPEKSYFKKRGIIFENYSVLAKCTKQILILLIITLMAKF